MPSRQSLSRIPETRCNAWNGIDSTYSAIGGAEMANVPRSILTLRPTKAEGLWMLAAAKRQTTGWQDEDGDFVSSLYVRRSPDPCRPAWLPVPFRAAEAEINGLSRQKITIEDLEAIRIRVHAAA